MIRHGNVDLRRNESVKKYNYTGDRSVWAKENLHAVNCTVSVIAYSQ